jgi:small neutral amino acid transporter SnatA (MarC family)
MGTFVESATLLLLLLNPFLLTIYLLDLVQSLDTSSFARVLLRAGLIATVVFALFALAGDAVFSRLLQARFASFQVFGGLLFLVVGLRFALTGRAAIEALRGEPEQLAGAVAMPFMIGPGTVGASVIVGGRMNPLAAVVAVVSAVALTVVVVVALKILHDRFHAGRERLVQRYVEVVGRASALVVGTFAVEMIMRGLAGWIPSIR